MAFKSKMFPTESNAMARLLGHHDTRGKNENEKLFSKFSSVIGRAKSRRVGGDLISRISEINQICQQQLECIAFVQNFCWKI